MQELRRIYRQGLAGHIQALERARTQGGDDGDAAILRIAHMLRGSGATYGFAEVSDAARAVEQADGAGREEEVDRLIALLRHTAAAGE